MFCQFENAAIVNAQTLKNAIAVKQPVIVDRDFGLFFWYELSIEIDNVAQVDSPFACSCSRLNTS